MGNLIVAVAIIDMKWKFPPTGVENSPYPETARFPIQWSPQMISTLLVKNKCISRYYPAKTYGVETWLKMIATDPFGSPDFLVSESMLTGRE